MKGFFLAVAAMLLFCLIIKIICRAILHYEYIDRYNPSSKRYGQSVVRNEQGKYTLKVYKKIPEWIEKKQSPIRREVLHRMG